MSNPSKQNQSTDRESLISNAILVRKKDIIQFINSSDLSPGDDIQFIYQEFARKLHDIDINKRDFLLENRIFLNTIHIYELQDLIDAYFNANNQQDLKVEQEIISLLTLWMPDITFVRIIPTSNKKEQQQRITLECNSVCKDSRIKFYMKLTINERDNIGHSLFYQEKEFFNDVSFYSAKFLSMKYQKVLSEHIIMTASTVGIPKTLQRGISCKGDSLHSSKYFIDVVATDYCEYTLREIIYPSKQLFQQQSQQQKELVRIKSQSLSNSGQINGYPPNLNGSYQSQSLIEKFSFQHLQKDLVESLFFMHTRGYTHNAISLDTVYYDKYINAFVIGGFDKMKRRVHNYDSFKQDIRALGLVLLEFLAAFYNIKLQEDVNNLDDQTIRTLITNLHVNKLIQTKKNFILLNLNLYQQRNILFDIFPKHDPQQIKISIENMSNSSNGEKSSNQEFEDISNIPDRPFDIVELAISLNIQHCLIGSTHSTMKSFLSQNEVFDENTLSSHLIDPLNNKLSYWKYKGTTKNGLFDGLGEIFFDPPIEIEDLETFISTDRYQDNQESPLQNENDDQSVSKMIVQPPALFNAVPSRNHTPQQLANISRNQSSYILDIDRKLSNMPSPLEINHNKLILGNQLNRNSSKSGFQLQQENLEEQRLRQKDSFFNVSAFQQISGNNLSNRNSVDTNLNTLGDETIKKQKIRIFKGIWESGFNQKYLNFVGLDQFKEFYLLNNYMKIFQHNSHQELQFSVRSDRPTKVSSSSKIIDLQFSFEKEHVIDSLNILIKYLQIPVARITFDLKGAHQRKITNEAQNIELQADDGSIISILFDSNYVIKEEEFYIILEKATLSTYLVLQMTHTQICDKFFYGMSFNTKLQYLSHLQISHSNKITDEGFLYFVRNCPSQHLSSLDLSFTQLSNISIMELTVTNKITKLIQLNISHNPLITENAIIEFVKSPNSFYISHLNLSGLDISDNFIEILCLSPFMKNISEIIMNDCPKITFKIFETFTKSESVNFIKRIELSNCLKHSTTTAAKKTGFFNELLDKRKSKQEFRSFTKTDKLGHLNVLNLQGCQILHNHIKQLANSHSMKQLEEINISSCEHINDECIKEISTSQNFVKLRILYLSNIKNLTPTSIELIGNSKYLTSLDQIHLDGCEKIDKNSMISSLNFVNFQNLKVLKIDENQYTIQLLRQINFSNKNSVQTFWRMQSIEIVIQNPDLFFKLNISEILSFNQKPIKFIVNKLQESSVIQKLAVIINHQILNLQESNCRINVNNVVLNEKMIEDIKRQKQLNTNSFCNADLYNGNFKQVQRTLVTDSFKKENHSLDHSFAFIDTPDQKQTINSTKTIVLPHSFQEQKVYCKNECFKAMHYLKFVKELKKLDLSYSKNINLPGYQFIKECTFFPNLVELNLQNLPILNKHIQQMCYGISFTSLRILNLKSCFYLTFQGFEHFLQSGIADTVQYLDVNKSGIEGTDFSLCLPEFTHLSQLNQGYVNINLSKQDIVDEEKVKKKITPIFSKVRTLFYINQLSFQIHKLKITSQVLLGISSILMDHFNTITSLQIIFCNAKNMNSEQSINFWSSIAQLVKLKSLSLIFQSCKNIDKLFLKNLFFGISVLTQMEEIHLAFPKTEINISQEDFTPLCVAMTRLQKLQIVDINFHEIPIVSNQFMEEFVYILGKLENIRNLSIDYSWILNFSMTNTLKLFESLETSKMKLYTFYLDLEMCNFNQIIWKKIKKYILSQNMLRELSLNISYCLELKEKSVIKFINQCLELKMLKILKLQLWGVTKISQKSKETLKQNTNLYMIDTFDLSIQEAQ